MLTTIFTRLRSVLQPRFMRNIDQYLLTHHALVWETRVHWFTLYATALLLLLVGAAFLVPISFPNEIKTFHEIKSTLEAFQVIAIWLFLLVFTLFVNGFFGRFFKTGYIQNNQKSKSRDLLIITGIYAFMVFLAMLCCSAFHYTLIIRTHFVIQEKENYALLDKYAKISEFYKQDTLKIKGFERVQQYINPVNLGFSHIDTNHEYYDKNRRNYTDSRVVGYEFFDIPTIPVNQALYDILPKNTEFYKIKKNSFEKEIQLVKNKMEAPIEMGYGTTEADIAQYLEDSIAAFQDSEEAGFRYESIAVLTDEAIALCKAAGKKNLDTTNTIAKNIANQTLGIDVESLQNKVGEACEFVHYTTPSIALETIDKSIKLDNDTVTVNHIQKTILNDVYSAKEQYRTFFIKQALAFWIVGCICTLLLLSLHAYRSYRFVSLMPAALMFSIIIVDEFTHERRFENIIIFSLLFIIAVVFWHRKAYLTNPLRLGVIYIIGCILFCIPFAYSGVHVLLSNLMPYVLRLQYQNTIIMVFFIVHILLYCLLYALRNTRFSILTPFVYVFAFFWIFIQQYVAEFSYTSNAQVVQTGIFTWYITQYPAALFCLFLFLNLLSAPFLLSAIVRQTKEPK